MAAMFTFDLKNPMENKGYWVESEYILQFLWTSSQNLLLEVNFDSTIDEDAVD